MKTIGKYKVIARIAGPGLVLGAVFAMVLSGSSVGRAQASVGSPAVPAATPAKAAPGAQAGHPVAPAERQPAGTHEGIKVHGHWMIEVRSPDGKLLSHTEFENSLNPGAQGGAQVLPLFFTATDAASSSYTPGEWGILLGDPTSSPCASTISAYAFNNFGAGGGQTVGFVFNPPYCVLSQLAPPAAIYPLNCTPAPNTGCSYNLKVGNPNSGGLALTGSVVSASAGTISQVQTVLSICGPQTAPSACPTETSPDFLLRDYVLIFTDASLPQSSTSGTPCGGAGQISCAVNVPAAGDTINVQVTISFQ